MPDKALAKAYDFKSIEKRVYAWWEQNGFFKPSNDPNQPGFDPTRKPFVISIPPPNVTGELHLGHAMFISVEDLMIRYHRMKGEPTLWVPGTDHAGIATQLQVEKSLAKDGLTREQIGREEFLKRTWAWKERYGGIITQQIRALGASCDWSRERFTLDEGLSLAVREAFVRLYEKGLIYRGPRLINWSPGLKTAVSDLEVEYSEEPGFLYYFKYRLAGSEDEYIPIATTRPETILGDTAVAVHPEDPRYQRYIGRQVLVPVLNRSIPIIADAYVDREFGTGALKITPGHDPNDYAIGQRHGLPIVSVLDEAARVTEAGGPYAGMDRFEARQKLWEDMRLAGLVIKEEPYTVNIPRSQRGGEIVEPMISTQWFVQIAPLAEPALQAVQDGRIRIIPERFAKVYYNWLENIRDWCISRQLWWGHRIPVWYCQSCNETIVARQDPDRCPNCGSSDLLQDPDVLDTWFSSGLWPFSTLGWPSETPDLRYFYPTSMMETGYDILFFWVARMIMYGLEFTGEVPFHTVYLHGLIREEAGKKMSKSHGNAIDPLVVMDELGTDALRFTMLVGSTPGNDMTPSLQKVEANRNFANKIWNAARFVINAIENLTQSTPHETQTHLLNLADPDPAQLTLADRWILARLRSLTRDVERLFQAYQFGEAGRQIYEFFWGEFADWYIEIAKLQIADKGSRPWMTAQILTHILDNCLRLLHPFTPFITEEIWGHLKRAAQAANFPPETGQTDIASWEEALIVAHWSEPVPESKWEAASISNFSLVMDIVRAIRNLRSEKKVSPGQLIKAAFVADEWYPILANQSAVIATLSKLDVASLELLKTHPPKAEDDTVLVIGPVEIYLPMSGLINLQEERARLMKEIAEIDHQITRLGALLSGSFAEKAPQAVIQKEKFKLEGLKEAAQKIRAQLDRLK